jgi:hypothetical protein
VRVNLVGQPRLSLAGIFHLPLVLQVTLLVVLFLFLPGLLAFFAPGTRQGDEGAHEAKHQHGGVSENERHRYRQH